jgi:hypothetical protein
MPTAERGPRAHSLLHVGSASKVSHGLVGGQNQSYFAHLSGLHDSRPDFRVQVTPLRQSGPRSDETLLPTSGPISPSSDAVPRPCPQSLRVRRRQSVLRLSTARMESWGRSCTRPQAASSMAFPPLASSSPAAIRVSDFDGLSCCTGCQSPAVRPSTVHGRASVE